MTAAPPFGRIAGAGGRPARPPGGSSTDSQIGLVSGHEPPMISSHGVCLVVWPKPGGSLGVRMATLIGLKGLLQERPIPRLLVGVRGEQMTGLVEVREMSGQTNKIYVRGGLPVHVIGPDSLDRLDTMLVEAGLLSSNDVARAQAIRESSGRLMGQVLCELGLVGPDQLAEVLRWQVRRKLTRLFSPEQGTFAVNAADHPFGLNPSSPGAAIDPRTLVFPGILSGYSEQKLAAELRPLTDRLVRLRPVSSAQLNELGFESRHAPLLMHLRLAGFRLEPGWISGSMGPRPREAKAVLLSLFYLDMLEADRPLQPPAVPATPAQRAPTGPVPTLQRSVTGAVPVVAQRTPTGPITLERTPPPTSPALATPPPAPALAATPPPSPPPRHLTPLPQLDPAELYTLAQRLFNNGDLTRAEMAFEAVARADSRNQRVRAFLIWIHFWKSSEETRAEALELTVKTLREVMRHEQSFALGHYFIGALAKLQKDMAKAEQAFRAALQQDPNLIEAQRELRLMTLRKTR
jgi:hypothetical protein